VVNTNRPHQNESVRMSLRPGRRCMSTMEPIDQPIRRVAPLSGTNLVAACSAILGWTVILYRVVEGAEGLKVHVDFPIPFSNFFLDFHLSTPTNGFPRILNVIGLALLSALAGWFSPGIRLQPHVEISRTSVERDGLKERIFAYLRSASGSANLLPSLDKSSRNVGMSLRPTSSYQFEDDNQCTPFWLIALMALVDRVQY
jgi:hypothetical protein